MQRLAWILLLVAAACGKTPKAGKTPEATVKAYEAALRDGDAGAIYDMLSRRARSLVDAELKAARSAWSAHPEKPARFGSEREVLVAACRRGCRDVSGLQLVVMDVKQYGDRARVRLTALDKGRENERTLMLQREGAAWKLDTRTVLRDLRLKLMPPEPAACTTFS